MAYTTEEVMSTSAGSFEPLSGDSCGESDMEGLDLSLFEPQDTHSWCDNRLHAGFLHILSHYGKNIPKLCMTGSYNPMKMNLFI